MEQTPTEIAQHYSACLDSVNLINGIFAGTMPSDDPLTTVTNNQSHLLGMLAKDYWTDEDLTEIEAAANKVTDGVEFPNYVEPGKGPRKTGTFREFMALFDDVEVQGIIAATQSSVDIKLWYDQALAGDVWLGYAKVAGGLAALVSINLLTTERVEEILATDFDAQV